MLSQVQKYGVKRGGLYGFFIKGQTLGGTISETLAPSSPATSISSTPPSSVETDATTLRPLPDRSRSPKLKYTVPSVLEAVTSGTNAEPESELESRSEFKSDSETADSGQGPAPESNLNTTLQSMAKANKKRKAENGLGNGENKPKKRKRAVSGNNGALAVPAATIATFEGAAAAPNGPLPHAQAAGQSQSTGIDGVEPGEYGPNGYLYDPKPQKKPARVKTPKQERQEQMRKWKKEKRQERKIRNQQKDAEMKRFHKERKQKMMLEKLQQEDPDKYANLSHTQLAVQTNSEIKADKKKAREERKEQKKLLHRRLARQKKQNEVQLKQDVIHGMDIEEADLSNRKRRKAERLRARLDSIVEKRGGEITLEQAHEEIESKRLARKEQRQRRKEKKQQERKELKAKRAEHHKKKTNWQKERDDRVKAAAMGVPYDPAMTGANAIALKALGGQRPLPEFKPPSFENGAAKLKNLSEDKRKQYEARAKEKGISVEAYAARRAEKNEQKHNQSANLP